MQAKSTDRDKLAATNWPRQTDREQTDREVMISLHDFVPDFVAMILSQSEGLGKMALGIVKTYLGSPSHPIGVVRGQFVHGQLVRG